jgi:DNA mismatch endonuclease, patch repair protein
MRLDAERLSFRTLRPASSKSSRAGLAASAQTNTRCELVLRRALWNRGLRYRLHKADLPGRPDIVFLRERVVIFCDGDFWHGRNLEHRLAKLARGHNASYWTDKLRRNVERDLRQTVALESSGWVVLRFWETDILRASKDIVDRIVSRLANKSV